MAGHESTIGRFAQLLGQAAAETLWPTRCALCDMPGSVLCAACAVRLPFLDWWRSCKRCGSPFGAVQCDLCNPVGMEKLGRTELPFAACASAMVFTACSGQLVRVFKDQGEQRLAQVMAGYMSRIVPREWGIDAVSFIPATKYAYRRRGFDHGELLAQHIACCLGAPLVAALERPRTRDQRALGASGRVANLNGRFCAIPKEASGRRFVLVDDVMTTGATLCAASDALLAAGAVEVRCLTFARV